MREEGSCQYLNIHLVPILGMIPTIRGAGREERPEHIG